MSGPPVETTSIFKDDVFKGKIVLCSGGGSGICRGMTEALVRHGAKAVIISRSLDKLEKAASEMCQITGGEVVPIQADVRKPQDLLNAVDKTIKLFGRIDILIVIFRSLALFTLIHSFVYAHVKKNFRHAERRCG